MTRAFSLFLVALIVVGLIVLALHAGTDADVDSTPPPAAEDQPAAIHALHLFTHTKAGELDRFYADREAEERERRKQVQVASVRPAVRSTAVAAPAGSLHDLIRAGFARFGPVVAEQAVRVAGCESTGDSSGERLNPNATGSQGEVGLFQLHPRYQSGRAAKFGWSMNDLYDPAKNVTVAVDLYASSGWQPWTCRTAA